MFVVTNWLRPATNHRKAAAIAQSLHNVLFYDFHEILYSDLISLEDSLMSKHLTVCLVGGDVDVWIACRLLVPPGSKQ